MKTLSDLLLSSTLAVATLTAVASGALAQASPPTATLPEASLEAVDPPMQGHQETFSECMGYWEPATHMSKSEWHQACRRTLNGIDLAPPS
jgi:hypothetical protein